MPLDAILFLVGLTLVFVGHRVWKTMRKKQAFRASLREQWGEEQFDERLWERIPAYHTLWREHTSDPALDDQTWYDLDMDDVFALVDRTQSVVGQQYLYHLLRTPLCDAEALQARDALIRYLSEQAETREQLQTILHPLQGKASSYLTNLLFSQPPPRSPFAWLFRLSPFLVIAMLVGGIWQPALLLVATLYISVHLFIQHQFRAQVAIWMLPLRALSGLIDAGRRLAQRTDEPLQPQIQPVVQAVSRLRRVQQATRYVARSDTGDPLMEGLYGMLNMFFLLDVNALTSSLDGLKRDQAAIRTVYETLGYLDSLIAVASFRAGEAHQCTPRFIEQPGHCVAEQLAHPLLDAPVPNDAIFRATSALITGSNMAGKTTFIRSVGVNAILAQTIYTCTARRYEASLFRIQSLISREDDLLEDKSYFLAEVELIKRLLVASDQQASHLFIIDEIFKGTNTTERIAASAAVLEYLNHSGQHLTLVSTHDLELLDLLGDGWAFHHFSEIIDDDALRFDYTMRPGPASTRNALRILRLMNYPDTVVSRAFATANRLNPSAAET